MDLGLAMDIIKESQRIGADEAEVYIRHSKGFDVEVKHRQVDSITKHNYSGFGVRLIKDKRMGFAFSNRSDNFRDIIERAFQSLQYNEQDEYLSFASPDTTKQPPNTVIFDEAVINISEGDAIKNIMEIEDAAYENSLVKKTRKASGSFGSSEVIIVNSKGLECNYKSTHVSASILLVAEKDGDSHTGWDYQSFRILKNMDYKKIGMTAAQRATLMLGAKRISSFKGMVLLKTPMVTEFLGLLVSSFSAESVQKNRSMLKDKLGQKVMSQSIDIIDTALLDGLIGSKPYDAEGIPTQENILIKNGVLQGYLHNVYTANKDNTISTGNAVRGGFTSTPSVGINNLILKPAQQTDTVKFDEMLQKIDKGVYINQILGMHTANPISGDFSIGISGVCIENGEFSHPFKEATLSGNVLDFFKRIVAIGDDLNFYGNIGSPSLLIDSLDICA
ncbi:MAG: TldD/PmbA family protein [Thermodesulfovibrionales bacterium]|nr:TldD/PmbA family protein [Thermodesulfovibrionales bacterium]